MARLNKEEYEILKGLDDKWKWIARDEEASSLIGYVNKPHKRSGYWHTEDYDIERLREFERLFNFITWEDEEPYSIPALITEYEYSAEHVSHVANERVKALGNVWSKSEEAEVKKNKEWAQKEVDGYLSYEGVNEARNALVFAKRVIDQMDEPEVLSQDLPVLPKYVAEWIAKRRDDFDLYPALKMLEGNSSIWELTYKWYRMNTHKFVNAYLTGEYEVEEEPLFYVELIAGGYLEYYPRSGKFGITGYKEGSHGIIKLTEERIKSLPKGDVLFEHFSVKVDEAQND